MKIFEFDSLPFDEKTNYLWDHGTCLSQRTIKNRFILCIFELDNFYVQATYSTQDNKVSAIEPMQDVMNWECYVDCIIRTKLILS